VTTRDLTNFRGARALIVHADDANRETTLVRTLKQLGLLVAEVGSDNEPAMLAARADCDILFYDADQTPASLFGAASPDVPQVALIGHEVPSRLARVVRQRCCGFLVKPVRATGVFSALYIAFNEAAARRREADERTALIERQRGRRFVVKAILTLVLEQRMDDETAFRWLRRESMRRRIPIERVAEEIVVAAGEPARGQDVVFRRPTRR
jgi:AmiR/NasT family two-component response regulator